MINIPERMEHYRIAGLSIVAIEREKSVRRSNLVF